MIRSPLRFGRSPQSSIGPPSGSGSGHSGSQQKVWSLISLNQIQRMQGVGGRNKDRGQEGKERPASNSHHGDPLPKDPPPGGGAHYPMLRRSVGLVNSPLDERSEPGCTNRIMSRSRPR